MSKKPQNHYDVCSGRVPCAASSQRRQSCDKITHEKCPGLGFEDWGQVLASTHSRLMTFPRAVR